MCILWHAQAKQADALSKLGLSEDCKNEIATFSTPVHSHSVSPVLGRGSGTDLSSMSMTQLPPLESPSPKRRPTKDKPARQVRRRRPSSAQSPHKLLIKKQKKQIETSQSSPTFGGSPRKQRKQAVTTQESGLFSAPANPNAEPGSANWQYSRLPLEMELARGLSGKWAGIEETYLVTLRRVFRLLRKEREEVCQYFYLRRSVLSDGVVTEC